MFVLLLLPCTAQASFEVLPLSSKQEAMCGVGSGGDANCLWLNPAAPTTLAGPSFACTHRRLWGLAELSLSSLAYTHRLRAVALSAGVASYGFSQYRENVACVSCAWRVERALDVGINLKWMHRSIGRSGTDGVGSIDGGLLMRPLEDISIEMSIHNLNAPTVGVEPLPQDLFAGLIYRPAPGLTSGISLLKQAHHSVQLAIGEEFQLGEWLVQRAGFRRNPTQMSFGFGVVWAPLQIDYATVIDPLLGTTYSISLSMTTSDDG